MLLLYASVVQFYAICLQPPNGAGSWALGMCSVHYTLITNKRWHIEHGIAIDSSRNMLPLMLTQDLNFDMDSVTYRVVATGESTSTCV